MVKSFSEFLSEGNMKWKAGGFPYVVDSNGKIRICLFLSNNSYYGGAAPQMSKGGADDGEKPIETAVREIFEETGIPISDLKKRVEFVVSKLFKGESVNYMMHCYSFKIDKEFPMKAMEEGKGVWLSREHALSKIRKDHKIFLETFLEKIDK